MVEATCLAFDIVPSDIPKVYWKITRNDLKVKLRLYLGQRHALILQDYQTLSLVASNALGGGKDTSGGFDQAAVPKTKADAELMFKGVFG